MGLFELQRILGTGATAVVCAAQRRGDPDRVLALKVLRPEVIHDADLLSRTFDEAVVLRQLDHPNVLHVHHLHDYGGRLVVEMECVPGVGLDALLQAFPSGLPPGAALAIAQRVAFALDAAWSTPYGPDGGAMRIVHRDLKPSNVLLTAEGQVKVVDFGLAASRFRGRESGKIRATPAYAPPEGLTGAEGPAFDVYTLGRVLVHLLWGRLLVLPRDREAHDAQLDRQLGAAPFLDLPGPVDLSVRSGLHAMLAYDPAERPLPDEVALGLQRVLHHPAVEPGLEELGRSVVAPLLAEEASDPRAHPAWPAVAFLETELPTQREELPRRAVEARLQVMLQAPGWERDLGAIRRLLEQSDDWVEAPLLHVLERAEPPGWRFWVRQSTALEIEAALILLSICPSERACALARGLVEHEDDGVREAAGKLLELEGRPV